MTPPPSTGASIMEQLIRHPADLFRSLSSKIQAIRYAQLPEQNPVAGSQQGTHPEHSADFRDRHKIPGVKPATFVYPHADEHIGAEHRARFAVIKDIFQHNLQEDKRLSLKHPSKTEYRLKMCGTDVDEPKPAILVSHPWNDLKTGLAIMRTLSEPQVREQYDSSLVTVRFKIYLFLGPPFTYLGRPMKSLDILMKNDYLPGSVLVSDEICELVSTITCGVKLRGRDGSIFALTSAHAFIQADEGDAGEAHNGVTLASAWRDVEEVGDESEEDEKVYEFADVEYDLAELMEFENSDILDFRLSEPPTDQFTKLEHKVLKPNCVWVPEQSTRNRLFEVKLPEWLEDEDWIKRPNLDWALVEVKGSDGWLEPNLKHELIPKARLSERDEAVDILTSRGRLRGTIGSIPVFIANSRHTGSLCEVWTVSAVNSHFDVGDSGALVIDPVSGFAYGYVIAANQFKELYVVPLQAAMKQICDALSIGNREVRAFTKLPLAIHDAPWLASERSIQPFTGRLSSFWPVIDRDFLKRLRLSASVGEQRRRELDLRSISTTVSGTGTGVIGRFLASFEAFVASFTTISNASNRNVRS